MQQGVTETSCLLPDRRHVQMGDQANVSYSYRTLFFLALALLLSIGSTCVYRRTIATNAPNNGLVSGSYYAFSEAKSGLYVRVDEAAGGALSLSQSVPWLSGSNFRVFATHSMCYKLQAASGRWVRAVFGVLMADAAHEFEAACFYFEYLAEGTFQVISNSRKGRQYISLSASELYIGGLLAIGLEESRRANDAAVLRAAPYEPIRGVNLGGWFIPEYWKMPSFYANTDLK